MVGREKEDLKPRQKGKRRRQSRRNVSSPTNPSLPPFKRACREGDTLSHNDGADDLISSTSENTDETLITLTGNVVNYCIECGKRLQGDICNECCIDDSEECSTEYVFDCITNTTNCEENAESDSGENITKVSEVLTIEEEEKITTNEESVVVISDEENKNCCDDEGKYDEIIILSSDDDSDGPTTDSESPDVVTKMKNLFPSKKKSRKTSKRKAFINIKTENVKTEKKFKKPDGPQNKEMKGKSKSITSNRNPKTVFKTHSGEIIQQPSSGSFVSDSCPEEQSVIFNTQMLELLHDDRSFEEEGLEGRSVEQSTESLSNSDIEPIQNKKELTKKSSTESSKDGKSSDDNAELPKNDNGFTNKSPTVSSEDEKDNTTGPVQNNELGKDNAEETTNIAKTNLCLANGSSKEKQGIDLKVRNNQPVHIPKDTTSGKATVAEDEGNTRNEIAEKSTTLPNKIPVSTNNIKLEHYLLQKIGPELSASEGCNQKSEGNEQVLGGNEPRDIQEFSKSVLYPCEGEVNVMDKTYAHDIRGSISVKLKNKDTEDLPQNISVSSQSESDTTKSIISSNDKSTDSFIIQPNSNNNTTNNTNGSEFIDGQTMHSQMSSDETLPKNTTSQETSFTCASKNNDLKIPSSLPTKNDQNAKHSNENLSRNSSLTNSQNNARKNSGSIYDRYTSNENSSNINKFDELTAELSDYVITEGPKVDLHTSAREIAGKNRKNQGQHLQEKKSVTTEQQPPKVSPNKQPIQTTQHPPRTEKATQKENKKLTKNLQRLRMVGMGDLLNSLVTGNQENREKFKSIVEDTSSEGDNTTEISSSPLEATSKEISSSPLEATSKETNRDEETSYVIETLCTNKMPSDKEMLTPEKSLNDKDSNEGSDVGKNYKETDIDHKSEDTIKSIDRKETTSNMDKNCPGEHEDVENQISNKIDNEQSSKIQKSTETVMYTPADEEMKQSGCLLDDTSLQFPPTLVGMCKEEYRSSHENYLRGCYWSPDGTVLLTNSDDNIVRLFQLQEEIFNSREDLVPVLRMSEGETIYDLDWYPYMQSNDSDTCCFLTTSRDHPIHLWDSVTGRVRCSYRAFNQMDELSSAHSVSFSHDGSKIYSGFNKCIRIFDSARPGRQFVEKSTVPKKNRSRKDFRCTSLNQNGIISAIAFSNQHCGLYALGTFKKTVGLYASNEDEPIFLLHEHRGGITQLKFTSDGFYLFSGGRKDPEIICWDMRNTSMPLFKAQREVNTNQRIQFDIDVNSTYLFSGGTNHVINAWNIREIMQNVGDDVITHPALFSFNAHHDAVNGISLHPHGKILASTSGQRHFFLKNDGSASDSDEEVSKANKTILYDNSLKLWKL